MRQILIYGQDSALVQSVRDFFKDDYGHTSLIHDASDLSSLVKAKTPDWVILVGDLSQKHLKEIAKNLKEQVSTKYMILVALVSHFHTHDALELLESGVDIVEELDRELVLTAARIETLDRRIHHILEKKPPKLQQEGSIRLTPSLGELQIQSQVYQISPTSAKILAVFLENANHIVDREEIKRKVWQDKPISRRTIDAHISKLKSEIPELEKLIEKIYGRGYRLKAG